MTATDRYANTTSADRRSWEKKFLRTKLIGSPLHQILSLPSSQMPIAPSKPVARMPGTVRAVSTTQVNAFLREIAGIKISLKDFRTLMASAVVLESLSRISPAASARGRKKQVLDAVRAAADELSNTPAICRKSYVHDTIVTAFEDGILERFAATMKGYRSQSKREALLAQVVMAAAAA